MWIIAKNKFNEFTVRPIISRDTGTSVNCPPNASMSIRGMGWAAVSKTAGVFHRPGVCRVADIFLSYARRDATQASGVVAALQGEGWSVFWDREIPVGQTWEGVLEQQLQDASCVVVLWSPASVESVWVRIEANEAAERGILIPALIEETSLPLRFKAIQSANLIGIEDDSSPEGLKKLLDAVRSLVQGKRAVKGTRSRQSTKSGTATIARTIARIFIESGEQRGKIFRLTRDISSITIGRGQDCDWVFPEDFEISRNHCRLKIETKEVGSSAGENYAFSIIDSGSMNGTIVNGKRVERAVLDDGDYFQLGNVRLRLSIDHQAPG